jgi:nitrate/nitrite transporter NarK
MSLEIAFTLLAGLNLGVIIMNLPPVLTELMDLYASSYTQISVLLSALLWSHAAMQLPAGIIVDRLGIRATQVLSLACMCAGNLVPAVTPSLGWAVTGRAITGVGTGMAWLANLKLAAVSAPGGQAGAYQAFFAGFFSLGSILAYLVLPMIIEAGWQWAFVAPALLCLSLLILVPGLQLAPRGPVRPSGSLRRIVGLRSAWVLGSYHALSYGSMLSLGNWVPSLLAEASGHLSASHLVWGGAVVMLVSGLSRLCGGFIILRLSPFTVAHGSVLVLCILFTALAFIPTPGVVLGLALLTAWFGSINFGALFHLASRAASPESLGTLLGFINVIGNVGAVAFTLMFGWSKDTLGAFAWGFAALAALGVAVLVLGIRILAPAPVQRKV